MTHDDYCHTQLVLTALDRITTIHITMYWKLAVVITSGILAVESKTQKKDLDSDVVWQKVCVGMKFRAEDSPSPLEKGLDMLRTIYHSVEGAIRNQPYEYKSPLKMGTSNNDYRPTRQDRGEQKSRHKKTCMGYEATLPIPRNVHKKILENIERKKRGAKRHEAERTKYKKEASTSYKQPEHIGSDEWLEDDKRKPTPEPLHAKFVESSTTINGYEVDMDAVTKYIMDLLENPRRYARWVEVTNGAFKSEIIDYPPDLFTKRLLKLLERQEAMNKRNAPLNEE